MKSFVAMEYYALILNRTFTVHLCGDGLVGVISNGIVAASPHYMSERFSEQTMYENKSRLKKYQGINICSDAALKIHRFNFKILYKDISHSEFLDKKKWGMGPVQHTGILNIHNKDGSKHRELILLGKQDGLALANEIKNRLGR